MQRIYLTSVILFMSISLFAQVDSTNKNNEFIEELTNYHCRCRGCTYYDYALIIPVMYGEVRKEIMIYDDNLELYLLKNGIRFQNNEEYISYVKRILSGEVIIHLPPRGSTETEKNKDIYNWFCDIEYTDPVFEFLCKDKKMFLSYYFHENHEMNFNLCDRKVKSTDKTSIHDSLYLSVAIVAQLFRWQIPFYYFEDGCKDSSVVKYGYIDADVKSEIWQRDAQLSKYRQ